MSVWLKRLVIAGLVILVVATLINDVGNYLKGYYSLDSTTRATADAAAAAAKNAPSNRELGGRAAVEYANAHGAQVYGYDQTNGRCTVWTRASVSGTWLWGPVLAAMAGKPVAVWWNTPVPITGKADSAIF